MSKAADIDSYIAGFPEEVQPILQKVRQTIRKAAPQSEETISYQIPAFKHDGQYVIYFAAFKKHFGVYPSPVDDPVFKTELVPYRSGKATIRFLYSDPIPWKLITKVVKFRLAEAKDRAATKKAKKKPS